jgi:DNA primase
VRLCLDNDEPGQLAAGRIAGLLVLSRPSMEIEYAPPKIGKDYNEYLLLRIARNRARKKKLSRPRSAHQRA